jgi:hypothetical protein
VRQGLPAPAVIDPYEPIERISSPEFAAAPRTDKLRLIRSLEKEFIRGVDWREPLARLDDEQWRRFQDNFDDLMGIWFMDKVDTFHALRPRERRRFVEQEMGNLRNWPLLTDGSDRKQRIAPSGGGLEQIKDLAERMRSIYMDANRQERNRIQQFVMAVAQFGLQRMDPGRIGPGGMGD